LVVADRPDVLFAVSDGEPREGLEYLASYLYRSADGGDSWQWTGLSARDYGPLVLAAAGPQRASVIYAYCSQGNDTHGVFKSTDAGASWTRVDSGPQGKSAGLTSLAVDLFEPDTIWAVWWVEESPPAGSTVGGEERRVVRRSADGGAMWEDMDVRGLEGRELWTLLFDPSRRGAMYAVTSGPDLWGEVIYRSTDSGATWVSTGQDRPFEWGTMVASDPAGGGLYAATPQGLFKWVPGAE
jgi:photosystem II stability/assembly factor-like uncharacterized protein